MNTIVAWFAKATRRMRLSRRIQLINARLTECRTLDDLVQHALQLKHFRPVQKRTEILELLSQVAKLSPARICEIGGFGGGTALLFSRAAAESCKLLSVDIDYSSELISAIESLSTSNRKLSCINADSHLPMTVDKVRAWLGGELLDFLYIDGDHSLEGVELDFMLYSPLVRAGGLIAFHDIVPDHRTRFGKPTNNHTGGVPIFWRNIKNIYETEELVADWEQDGFGIGLLTWPGGLPNVAGLPCTK